MLERFYLANYNDSYVANCTIPMFYLGKVAWFYLVNYILGMFQYLTLHVLHFPLTVYFSTSLCKMKKIFVENLQRCKLYVMILYMADRNHHNNVPKNLCHHHVQTFCLLNFFQILAFYWNHLAVSYLKIKTVLLTSNLLEKKKKNYKTMLYKRKVPSCASESGYDIGKSWVSPNICCSMLSNSFTNPSNWSVVEWSW